jgi:hypothetical protein
VKISNSSACRGFWMLMVLSSLRLFVTALASRSAQKKEKKYKKKKKKKKNRKQKEKFFVQPRGCPHQYVLSAKQLVTALAVGVIYLFNYLIYGLHIS